MPFSSTVGRLVRVFAASLLAAVLAAPLAAAEAPAFRRGINFELWQTWTGRDAFLAPGYDRSNFPDWSKAVPDERLAALRRQGFDFVRLNVDPSPFFWEDLETERLLDGVMRATKRLLAADFRVIVDLHLVPETADRPQGLHWVLGTGGMRVGEGFSRHLGLVRTVANRLKTLPGDRVALELLNEPDQDWNSHLALTDRWPGQLAALYGAARRVAPDLALVLSGARGGGVEGLLRLDPSRFAGDERVIWSFHAYEPMALTHAGLPWETGPAHFLPGMPFPAAKIDAAARTAILADAKARIDAEITDPQARAAMETAVAAHLDKYVAASASAATIEAEFAKVVDWAKVHGIPPRRILLGEFGGYGPGMAPGVRAEVVGIARRAAEKAGFAWAIYTAELTRPNHSFGIVEDPATLRVEAGMARALGLK